jgi:hypothetical protein
MDARRLIGAVLAAVLLAACSTVGSQPTPVTTPAMAAVASSPSPTPVPTPTPAKPTAKPKPTLRPATLAFGKLAYDANACWESVIMDTTGHQTGGSEVAFSVTVKNTGQIASQPFTITTQSTDWFETNPWSYPDNWPLATGPARDARTDSIDGPAIAPGKSKTLKWHTFFLTPFDPHYSVSVDLHDGGHPQVWQMWTKTTICY